MGEDDRRLVFGDVQPWVAAFVGDMDAECRRLSVRPLDERAKEPMCACSLGDVPVCRIVLGS